MEDILDKALSYQRTYSIVGRSHYLASDHFARLNRWFGIPVVMITTILGTTIFGTLNESPDPSWRIVAGLLSLTGAVLAALQTSLGFAQRAERHKAVAGRYRSVKRRLELFCLKYAAAGPDQRETALAELEALNQFLEDLAAEAPSLPDRLYDRAVSEHDSSTPRPDAAAPR